MGRNTDEEKEYQKYYYPDTDVLRNKANVKNPEAAESFERLHSIKRLDELVANDKLKIAVDYNSYKEIHRYLFQDVWDWAGNIRTYTTGRGSAPFATPENIDREMLKRFEKINRENNCKGLSLDKFAERSAEHVAEINAIHPFVEGNGRTQRLFLHYLAKEAGYKIDMRNIDKNKGDWYQASAISFNKADYEPMVKCIRRSLMTIDPERDKFLARAAEHSLTGDKALEFSRRMQQLEAGKQNNQSLSKDRSRDIER